MPLGYLARLIATMPRWMPSLYGPSADEPHP
jgi:hypothetical protein